jgi:2-C-methyl-D-erythritol 4-phosphate cytidylyltransferase
MTYAIILAAGLGHRFKETPIKPLFPIKGKPLFLHSLNVFLSCKNIETIILVINKEHRVSYLKYIDKLKSKNCYLTFGDPKQRYKSLMNAMMYVQKNFSLQPNDIILTHDAARINVTPKIIKQSILVAQKYGYASTVLPIHDSIGEIIKTVKYLDRHNKYLIQTPQTIQYKY